MNHSSHPTRNVHSQRAQRIVCGAPFSSMRLRQPGHTAYLSPHCAGRLLASCGRATIVHCWGGAVTIFRDVRGTGICSRFTSSLASRSEEHTSELQSPCNLVCRLLLEKKKNN